MEPVTKKDRHRSCGLIPQFPSYLYYLHRFSPSVLPHFGCCVRGIERCVFLFFFFYLFVCLLLLLFFNLWKRFKSKNCDFEKSFQKIHDISQQMKRWKQPGQNPCWIWCEICHWLLAIQNFTVRWSDRNKISKHQRRIVQSWLLAIVLGSE